MGVFGELGYDGAKGCVFVAFVDPKRIRVFGVVLNVVVEFVGDVAVLGELDFGFEVPDGVHGGGHRAKLGPIEDVNPSQVGQQLSSTGGRPMGPSRLMPQVPLGRESARRRIQHSQAWCVTWILDPWRRRRS